MNPLNGPVTGRLAAVRIAAAEASDLMSGIGESGSYSAEMVEAQGVRERMVVRGC